MSEGHRLPGQGRGLCGDEQGLHGRVRSRAAGSDDGRRRVDPRRFARRDRRHRVRLGLRFLRGADKLQPRVRFRKSRHLHVF